MMHPVTDAARMSATRFEGANASSAQRGFTLVEVVCSLVIVAISMITLMAALGGATDTTIETVRNRKMRYLTQIIVSDVEVGKFLPDQEERYQEGSAGPFEGYGSPDDPDEYIGFEWVIKVLRDEVIIGGENAEALEEMGFEKNGEGNIVGRPVSNDIFGLGGEEAEKPPGQVKRKVVIAVRRPGETAEDDQELVVMTYLPYPDEESQTLGGSEGEGAGGIPGGPPGSGAQPRGDGGGAAGRGGK